MNNRTFTSKHNTPQLTATALAAAILLTACGGGDGDSSHIGSGHSIEYSVFDKEYNQQQKGIYRYDYKIWNGYIRDTRTLVEGTQFDVTDSTYDEYYFASNFLGEVPGDRNGFNVKIGPTIRVQSPTEFSYQIAGSGSASPLTLNYTFKELDLSGVALNDNKLDTDVKYPGLENLKYPAGSKCKAFELEKPSFAYYQADSDELYHDTRIKNISDWIASQQQQGKQVSGIEPVGDTNQYKAARLINDDYNKAVVEYKGVLYTAYYTPASGDRDNTDPAKGEVGCYMLNKTAADYAEAQIKRSARL